METPSRTNRVLKLVGKYLWSRRLYTVVGTYFVFSAALLAATGIDICIPCIFTAILGVHCPGCGLTTSFIHMMQLDFIGAWEANPMGYLVLPAGIFFVGSDIWRFWKANQSEAPAATPA